MHRDLRPGAALGALRNVPPLSHRVAWSLKAAHPQGYRPLRAGDLPWSAAAVAKAVRPPERAAPRTGLLSSVPFCLLDPWPPKLATNRKEAPLAFRMKSEDFLNSSGHSCIRSGPCAFPTRRVKFVFEKWGPSELKMAIFFSCILTDTTTPKFGPYSFLKCSHFFGLPDFVSREPTVCVEKINFWATTGRGAF